MSKKSLNATLIRDQIGVLVQKDFKLKYNSTALGFAWCLLVPLMMSCVYYFVFGVLMKIGRAPNYFLYLISGNFLWQFFSSVVMQNAFACAQSAVPSATFENHSAALSSFSVPAFIMFILMTLWRSFTAAALKHTEAMSCASVNPWASPRL